MKKFLVSFALALVAFAGVFLIFGDKLMQENKPIGDDPKIIDIVTPSDEKPFTEDENNKIERKIPDELFFAIIGIDSNRNSYEKSAPETISSKGLRSDVVILTKVNFKTGKIKLLSLSRDLRVLVKGSYDKLGHAHAYGGADLTMRTVREFCDIDVDYYVKINFKGLIEIVDAVGGVDFDIPVDMNYDDPTAVPPLNIHFTKGMQHLNGKQSHDVLRFRHNNGADYYPGDFSREQVQQMWIKEFIKTALQPKNITKLPIFVQTYLKVVETNIPVDIILDCVENADKIKPEEIENTTISGEPKKLPSANGQLLFYHVADPDEVRAKVHEMFEDYKLETPKSKEE